MVVVQRLWASVWCVRQSAAMRGPRWGMGDAEVHRSMNHRLAVGAFVLALAVMLVLPAVALAAPVRVEDTEFTYFKADGTPADVAVYPGPATWLTYSDASMSGGGNHFSGTAGAYAEVTFEGTSIAFITTLGNNRGDVAIYLDGVYQTTFSEYSAALVFQQVMWSKSGLTPEEHTLRVVCVGAGPSSTDYAEIDAIEYEPVPEPEVTSTSAASLWSVAAVALAGLGLVGFTARRLTR